MTPNDPTRPGNPDWFDAVTADYTAGVAHAFIVHGNVHDYVEDATVDQTITDYLAGRLGGRFSVVAYSPDQGITFPGEDSDLATARALALAARDRFETVTGLGAGEMSEIEKLAMQAGGLPPGQSPGLPKGAAPAIAAILDFLNTADGGDPVYLDLPDGTKAIAGGQGGDQSGMRALAILERMDLICPPADVSTMPPGDRAMLGGLHRIGRSEHAQSRGGLLVMLAPGLAQIHDDLKATSAGIAAVEIKPPTLDQRRAYLTRAAQERELRFAPDMPLESVARNTAGLGRRHIEDIALRAVQQTDGLMTKALVDQRRRELMDVEYSGILEAVETDITLEMVGGHETILTYLKEELIALARSDNPQKRQLIAMGLMMAGPSGTGKTFLAQALANALGRRMIRWRPENIKGKYVGESEQKLAKAIAGTEANAPCLVFFDEIDQSFRRGDASDGSGGGAVESNQFGRLLEWLSDTSHRGTILAVGATNMPLNLDPALLRPGRFDLKVPVLVPQSTSERQDILYRVLKRNGVPFTGTVGDAVDAIGETTDGWTPAELENLVLLARRIQETRDVDLSDALGQARRRLKSATRDVERMTLSALSICDDLAVVPEKYQALVGEPAPTDDTTPARATGPRRGRTL